MYNFLLKNGIAAAMGVGVVIILLFFITITMGLSSAGYDTNTDLLTQDMSTISFFNFGLYATFVLIAIAFVLMFGGVIWDMARNFRKSKNFVFGIIALIILFVVLYYTATFEQGGTWDDLNSTFFITEGSSKLITAGIYTCGILLALAALSIVVSEVRGFFK